MNPEPANAKTLTILVKPLQLTGQRLAIRKFQQVQRPLVSHRDHRPQRRVDPMRAHHRIAAQRAGALSQKLCKCVGKTGLAVKSRLQLRINHAPAALHCLKTTPQPLQPGHLQEGHAILTLKRASRG